MEAFFTTPGVVMNYEYDFGDGWEHEILLEGILLREPKTKYPRCIDGERACPPEDCGGPWGYENMLKILADPEHEEHEQTVTWLGGSYDPARFDLKKIRFDNPAKRWKKAFAEP